MYRTQMISAHSGDANPSKLPGPEAGQPQNIPADCIPWLTTCGVVKDNVFLKDWNYGMNRIKTEGLIQV